MRPALRKISLEAASANGSTVLRIFCLTPLETPRPGSVSRVCWHMAEMPITEAIARWGGDRSLSDLPLVCAECGGRIFDATTHLPATHRPSWR